MRQTYKSAVPNLGSSRPPTTWKAIAAGTLLAVVLVACTPAAEQATDTHRAPSEDRPDVVATTTLVGDVVSRVGGDHIDLTVMLPVGADPHGFEPKPRDVAAVAEADLVFLSGLGLEEFLSPVIDNAGGEAAVVELSDGFDTIRLVGRHHDEHANDPAGADVDPHVWLDPSNVAVWADNAATALSNLDPANADRYAANAAALKAELTDLDEWIRDQVASVPDERRQLIADHETFAYFAARYGFEQVGTLLPGLSTLSEPSAAELAALEDSIADLGVPAILVGTTMNPDLARRVADDTGVRIVTVYTGSLSEPGGPAANYDALMRHNVSAIVESLR